MFAHPALYIFGAVAFLIAAFITILTGHVALTIVKDRSIPRLLAFMVATLLTISMVAFAGSAVIVASMAYPALTQHTALILFTVVAVYAILRHFKTLPEWAR